MMTKEDTHSTVLKIQPYIKSVCRYMYNKNFKYLSGVLDVDDLINDVNIRLLKHTHKYDSARSDYITFSFRHIRGEILDILRKLIGRNDKGYKSKAPIIVYYNRPILKKNVHKYKTKDIDDEVHLIMHELQYIPDEMTPEYLDIKTLDEEIMGVLKQRPRYHEKKVNFSDVYEMYKKGYKLREIAKMYNVTDSRVCQVMKCIKRLAKTILLKRGESIGS